MKVEDREICPHCHRDWPLDCEQSIWIEDNGRCLACRNPNEIDGDELHRIGDESLRRKGLARCAECGCVHEIDEQCACEKA